MDIIFGVIIGLFIGIVIFLLQKRRLTRRIDELSSMIEELNRQNYGINIKQDEFSKLEDDIYKLFLKNVEERDNIEKLYEKQSKNLEDIAHQIKTPITAIMFQMENMDIEEERLKSLNSQLERLNSLTDTLLKLSSLESNITKMKRESIKLKEIIDYSLDVLDGDIQKRNIEIEKGELEENIDGDYYWISEGIINILKNAISVSKNKKIIINSRKNPIYTELSIEDEGGGILEKNMNKIFRRFYKSPDSKGFGIGLSMAKAIIEANKGEIEVSNTEKGAIFKIKFYKVT